MTKKTLKDLQEKTLSQKILKMELKAEAIKWIKEDLEMLIPTGEYGEYQQIVKDILINRWMKRCNITKKDLK